MSNFDYPTLNNPPKMEIHSNHPYQNFFQANPMSENVKVFARDSGYIQPRLIVTKNIHGEDPEWYSTFQMPCHTILPQSYYYHTTQGIILPP